MSMQSEAKELVMLSVDVKVMRAGEGVLYSAPLRTFSKK